MLFVLVGELGDILQAIDDFHGAFRAHRSLGHLIECTPGRRRTGEPSAGGGGVELVGADLQQATWVFIITLTGLKMFP